MSAAYEKAVAIISKARRLPKATQVHLRRALGKTDSVPVLDRIQAYGLMPENASTADRKKMLFCIALDCLNAHERGENILDAIGSVCSEEQKNDSTSTLRKVSRLLEEKAADWATFETRLWSLLRFIYSKSHTVDPVSLLADLLMWDAESGTVQRWWEKKIAEKLFQYTPEEDGKENNQEID